jgi:predicted Ser/Thr protein kinase
MLDPGTEIGGYRIDQFVASGGMGVVYKATQLSLERVVALKLLSTNLSDDEAFRKRFHREAVLQAALEHPNIVPVYEAGESARGLYIAMRFVNGPSLKTLIGELDRGRALTLLAGVASALDAAHAAGLVHRDIKPQNILVDAGGHPYLADFGLTTTTGLSSVTQGGQFLGTLDYISPEQIEDEEPDARSDLYSLGAVLYECMTGSVPFPRSSKVAVIYAHLEQTPRPARELAPELPPELDAVLERALAKRREERFASAGELIGAARAALDGGESAVAESPPVTPRGATPPTRESTTAGATLAKPRPSRLNRRIWIAAVACCLLTAVVGYLAGHAGSSGPSLGRTTSLAGDGVTVRVPAAWQSRSVTLPELFSSVFAAAGPTSSPDAVVAVGRTGAFGPSLVPRTLRSAATVPAFGQAVRVSNGIEGRLYRVAGQRRYEVVFVPTGHLVAVGACVGPASGAGAVFSVCDRVLDGLQVPNAFGLDPRASYAGFLNSVLGTLTTQAQSGLAAYAAAKDRGAQQQAAAALASAFAAAGRAFAGLIGHGLSPPEFGVHAGILAKLAAVSKAYGDLASAAKAGSRQLYSAAQSELGLASQDLSARLDELGRGGYSLS